MRPHWLRGYAPAFMPTAGHTEPAAREVRGVHVLSEDGARLDTRRVLPASDWLDADQLAELTTAEEREEARRAAVRARCEQFREETRISRREWGLYAAACVVGVLSFAWLPNVGPGYGWALDQLRAATEIGQVLP